MLYNTITIKDKEYKLRLSAKSCVDLEKRMGTNPLNVFVKAQNEMPSFNDLLLIFHAALQCYQHNITLDNAYTLYDDYCEEGGNLQQFVQLIVDIFKGAGFIPEEEAKNFKGVVNKEHR